MKKYYFTFGQNHYSLDGKSMADYWVCVSAPSYGSARAHFCNYFATPVMGSPTKWGFQYTAEDWQPQFFPRGEYQHLTAPADSEPDQERSVAPVSE